MKAPGTLRRFADLDALSRAAADDFAAIVRDAVAARGACHVALSGGSTPERLFKLLAAAGREALPWDRVELWWGDERTVAPDHKDSNYGMAKRALLDPLGISTGADAAHVHRMAGERADHDAAARDYERTLTAALGAPPVLDLVLLGMGPDGHTASLFPGTPALDEAARFVVANPVDSPVTHGATVRITLTAPAINAARHVRFLIGGADKADSLAHVLDGAREPRRFPSQLVDPTRGPSHGDLVWMIADDAASQLGGLS